jgi:hypothetical protein
MLMRKTVMAVALVGAGAVALAGGAGRAAALGAPGTLVATKAALPASGQVQEVRWRGRGLGVGLALGLGLGLALAPRYGYAGSYYHPYYSYPYQRTYFYHAPPRKHCWYSYRYDGWVCRRHYW